VTDTQELRAAFDAMLAERESERREAQRRPPHPHVGCCWCGVGVSDPIHRGVHDVVPPWSLEFLGATCAVCALDLRFLTEDEHRVIVTQRLLGLPRLIPATAADPVVQVAAMLPLFRDDDERAEANPSPWSHVDVDQLRAAYDQAVRADEPVYETGEPCPGCGRSDMWLRVPPRQDLIAMPVTNQAGELVEERFNVVDHPESLRCGRCLTWERS
jgi:hypothetical protein